MSTSRADAPKSVTTFTVAMPRPDTHLFEIAMDVAPFGKPVVTFDLVLPVWAPGSYAVRDFARNVRDLVVTAPSGETLAVEKVEKSRWRVTAGKKPTYGPFHVAYRVYANELTVRTSHLDSSHGYGNGTSLFFYVEGRKEEPQRVRFVLPKGWRATIALPDAARTAGAFDAKDYDELVDSPFECGVHRTFDFTVRGKPHTLALWGRGNEDPERVVRDLTKIVEAAADVFGGLPYDRYIFLVHISPGGGGGLEHRASQSDGIAPWRFRPEKSYREVLGLFAHEFFHAWNVKRIHPEALGPFDYTREVYTRDLWAMEGITSYYEGLLPTRAGLFKPKHVFEYWAKEIQAHRENPGTAVQTAEMASFDAWIRLYHPDENSPNVSESYYRRGQIIGLALDLTIRKETSGKKSLDDVLRVLWERYGSRGVGYPEGAYEKTVSGVLGKSADDFFARHVRGVETPRFEELLPFVGLTLKEKADKDEDEKDAENGDGKKENAPVKSRSDFGWKTKKENERLVVTETYAGRAAYESGISANDELVAFDGHRADEDQIKRIERDLPPKAEVKVTVFRRAQLLEIPVKLGARRAFTYEITADEKAGPNEKALFSAWLGQPFPEKKSDEKKSDEKNGGEKKVRERKDDLKPEKLE